ncbi:glucose-6-phosphate isomerase [Mesonia sp. K7]|uniref:glucose-6-phosphate isomerase n=1 Tax=Mesonia sp. K7 TaxID=2218606 RepID=UPI000DAA5159|nr:glucose-6-phosphate isomerase [Mesonia sp. K7]PZD76917.1 glucose-6-phosphate isomerase [Mesonia sp. K7]
MSLKSINPTTTQTWKKLQAHYEKIKDERILDFFEQEPNRVEGFSIDWNTFFIDFSKNRIDQKGFDLLIELAKELDIKDAVEKQYRGEILNKTESRAVLHTALRQPNPNNEIQKALDQIEEITENVTSGNWKGCTGKPIKNIVNIGIGGSDLGPKMVVEGLKYYKNHLNSYFISNIDDTYNQQLLSEIDFEESLFIVVSKSFGTKETLGNAKLIIKRFQKECTQENVLKKHFIAITTQKDKAVEFGITGKNILPIWDWVGGRFSLCSAVGLSISLTLGFNNFKELLNGASEVDDHFLNEKYSKNIPTVMALLSIWYNNFYQAESHAVVPYSQYLSEFVPYLQQTFMESNGKSVDRNQEKVNYQTGSLVWGDVGSNAQHAFFQLLHQGTKLIPVDFIGFKKPLSKKDALHTELMANFFAQTQALLQGKSREAVLKETSENEFKFPYRIFEGNKPSTTILIDQLTPKNLGSLIAIYEHKTFVEGVIWNIFSFDQWGVELGKQLSTSIQKQIETKEVTENRDKSTKNLLHHFLS